MYYEIDCIIFIIVFGVITANMEHEKAKKKRREQQG